MSAAPETFIRDPGSATILPETVIVPPARTDPVRKPSELGVSSVVPLAESDACGPISTVGTATPVAGKRISELVAPCIIMFPPGTAMEPSTATVSPVNETVANGSVKIDEPSDITRSPWITGAALTGSFVPMALNVRSTGVLRAWGKSVGTSDELPVVSKLTNKLSAVGVTIVPGAITKPGRKLSEPPVVVSPIPFIEKLVNPPWLKKPDESNKVSALLMVPPI